MCSEAYLGKARFLSGDIAPFLDDGLLDLPWVGPGPGADLLGDIHALQLRSELGYQLGHVVAGPLRLQVAFLLGNVLDNGLCLVVTLFRALIQIKMKMN